MNNRGLVIAPTKTDCVDSDLTSSNTSLSHLEKESLFWMKTTTNPQNRNLLRCSNCDLTIDRDFNGARNIYLKYMGERTNTLKESKLI
uniref:Cas12f1-like TNB domain-containing protein n=1 Tax=Pyramimonas orientalis virus TaxID=455367 RepID=A0A7L9AXN2_POV01|nr:hypothetical protein HWQ62_00222 [Pyramimonas orientalis virus]